MSDVRNDYRNNRTTSKVQSTDIGRKDGLPNKLTPTATVAVTNGHIKGSFCIVL
jgi:hypothetical protein